MPFLVTWRRLVIAIAALGAGGLLFAWSGLLSVAASSGHWAITDWFLHWVMQNSVRTYSMTIETPDLSNPGLVHRGAGHYETGCAPCHGSPAEPQDLSVAQATPPPPTLNHVNQKWEPKHLFWIVRHGIKFTGMPAWVALQREDEIWAMVAFLREQPSMSAERYRELAYGDVRIMQVQGDSVEKLLSDCARCHGRDGAGRDNDAFPLIGGQDEAYLRDALRAYANGTRHSGIMQPAARRGPEADLAVVANHYASQRSAATKKVLNPALVSAGERIAHDGIPGEGVPACLTCHGATARLRNARFPRLDGQHTAYLAGQLHAWRAGARGGGPYGHFMETIASRLNKHEIDAVSQYFASRPASR
ncbi:MAG: c-type cytochrome [Xanthobacteraceae bacterium]